MASNYKLYSYRWVVLAVFMFINLTIQMLWITLCADHRTGSGVLRGDRSADRPAGNDVHDRLHPAFHSGLVGDRYVWISTGCQHRRGHDGDLWHPARICRGKLFPGLVEHDRDRGCPAVPAQCLDQGAGQLVCHRRAGDGGWAGDTCQFGGNRAGHGPYADPDRIHLHPNRAVDLWRNCGIFCSPVCCLFKGNAAHASRPCRAAMCVL